MADEISRYISAIRTLAMNFNSLWPGDAIWRCRSGPSLAQVITCCLTALSHYLGQCWHIIKKVQWHSSEGNFTRDTSNINHQICLENHFLKMSLKSPRGQWVMPVSHPLYKCSTQCLLCVYINFKSVIERLFCLIPRPTSTCNVLDMHISHFQRSRASPMTLFCTRANFSWSPQFSLWLIIMHILGIKKPR